MAAENMTQFPSGAVRSSDADNERWDLITPIGLRRLAQTCAEGARKYGDHNWQKGIPATWWAAGWPRSRCSGRRSRWSAR